MSLSYKKDMIKTQNIYLFYPFFLILNFVLLVILIFIWIIPTIAPLNNSLPYF